MKRCRVKMCQLLLISLLLVTAGSSALLSYAEPGPRLSKGQTLYVPVYSNVFHTDKERPFDLTATLSVRSTDLANPMTVISANYYDSTGKLVKSYVDKPVKLGPLASIHYSVKESDKSGGFGANFIVKWTSSTQVNEPVIECVMISTKGQQGISFITQGRVIQDEIR